MMAKAKENNQTILITRPKERAAVFARDIKAMGGSTLIEPMLRYQKLDFDVPDLALYQALIFTSAYAVECFAERCELRSIPVYVVGETTKKAAKKLGFKDVFSAEGSGKDLVQLISDKAKADQPLLYVRGEYVSYPLQVELEALGFMVGRITAYDTAAEQNFSQDCIEALERQKISAVTFFSKRTAEAFISCVEEADLTSSLASIKALCISETVLNYVQLYKWQGTYAAQTPDRKGIGALVKQHVLPPEHDHKLGRSSMSQTKNKPIENAREVIERFGGIRPMAKKIDVAVTTIQGWKKRDVIPATRREVILDAAVEHNVDLSDIVPGAASVANQNQPSAEAPVTQPSAASVPSARASAPGEKDETETMLAPDELEEKLAEVEKKVVGSNTWIAIGLIVLILIALFTLLWPQSTGQYGEQDRLSALEARTQEIEGEVADVKDQQSFFGTLIPEDLDQQLDTLQERAGQAREQAGQALDKAREVSSDVLGENAGTIEERVVKLEGHLQEITGSPVLAGMLERVQGLSAQPEGQSQLDAAMGELSKIMGNLDTQLAGSEESVFEETLDAARGENEALGNTFANVPATDLKAAALLLTMTQFRSSLNRDNEAFDGDLEVLMGLVGEENTELRASLERLAPHAQEGVLTPSGLTDEFKGLAGDAVVASLKGEDVSVKERAQARIHDVFEVEKDGELISGTETQAKVATAENLLEKGNLEQAIATVETLDPAALQQMSGWLSKAKATLVAENLKKMLTGNINMQAYGAPAAAAAEGAGALLPGTSQLIQNDETGINVLRRTTIPNAPRDANPYD